MTRALLAHAFARAALLASRVGALGTALRLYEAARRYGPTPWRER